MVRKFQNKRINYLKIKKEENKQTNTDSVINATNEILQLSDCT